MRLLALAAVVAVALATAVAHAALAIEGGAPSEPQPYVGRLTATRDLGPGSVGERCGAVLIAPAWALTAAHCLRYEAPSPYGTGEYRADDLTVGFGSLRADGAGGHTAQVAEIFRGAQDVALLRLAADVPVTPVRLADRPPAGGAPAVALGWGRGTGSASLEAADMQVEDVGSMLVTAPDRGAGHPGFADSGDSGGPLLLPLPGGGHVLAGIAKSAMSSARGARSNSWVRADRNSATYAWLGEYIDLTPARGLPHPNIRPTSP